ncbi:hypothetical protein LZ32DRAFT_619754 [Colletotrichum eremochloae]|nr:hypothetical protein LZ32DRAFT_619754 [Colletotrichum eremochloae]
MAFDVMMLKEKPCEEAVFMGSSNKLTIQVALHYVTLPRLLAIDHGTSQPNSRCLWRCYSQWNWHGNTLTKHVTAADAPDSLLTSPCRCCLTYYHWLEFNATHGGRRPDERERQRIEKGTHWKENCRSHQPNVTLHGEQAKKEALAKLQGWGVISGESVGSWASLGEAKVERREGGRD